MHHGTFVSRAMRVAAIVVALICCYWNCLFAAETGHKPSPASAPQTIMLRAARVFDGVELHHDYAVLVADGKIVRTGPSKNMPGTGVRQKDLGDATLMPGIVEMHSHIVFQKVPQDVVLRHGITTARDLGGPLRRPAGVQGHLRLLTSGPILTAPGGYPLSVFGHAGHHAGEIALAVDGPARAREAVIRLIKEGAAIIKIALEPGGETGAPWTSGHGMGSAPPPWPLLSIETVRAIVATAHELGRKVSAHVGEAVGAELSLAAGVDEWAHVPCMPIAESLLRRAVNQGVRIVSTLDTLAACPGIRQNAMALAKAGAILLYGAEIGHRDVPWGVDAEELHKLMHVAGMDALTLFRLITSRAGTELGLAPLGTFAANAPADIIAVRGNPLENFKLLEYPDLVMAGGHIVVDRFADVPNAAPRMERGKSVH